MMKTNLHIAMGIVLGLLMASGVWLAAHPPQGNSVALPPPPAPQTIQVNVMGAVVHPGLYELNINSRVADAVEVAGGFVAEVNKKSINLAAHVENGQELYIPYAAGFIPDVELNPVVVTKDTPSPPVPNEQTDNSSARLAEKENTTDTKSAGPAEINNLADTNSAFVENSGIANTCSNGAVGSGAFVWPAENHFLSGKDYEFRHLGIDIAAGEGAPVYATDSGVVTAMGNDESGYGNVIQIDHRNGYVTVYAHLNAIGVKMCQSVHAGERIGAAGSTGNATGAHLHFEVLQDDWSVDPWSVLPQ